MPANLENSEVATGLEKVSFHSNPKERQSQRMLKLCTIALISHASKVLLKILQARLQQYMNRELPDVQAGFRKGKGTRAQIANICWIIEKAREFQKNVYFFFIDYIKTFDCVDCNKLENSERDRNTDHLTCLLRNLYAGQEATVRTGHGTTDWFQKGKGVRQGCILSPCSFNLDAEYVMRNSGLDEAQAGIKIAGRNINNLRYVDDTTLMAEGERKKVKLLSLVQLFATPWTVAFQDPLSMGFSRQEYWSGLPFPSPGYLPNPEIEPGSPALHADTLSSEPLAGSEEELKGLLMKVKEESEKVDLLKLNIQKTKIMASGPITSWQIDGEKVETVSDLFFWAPKSLQMVIAAVKLKDAYSLEVKLRPT